jgi:predicted nuclease with TOPRIM domain
MQTMVALRCCVRERLQRYESENAELRNGMNLARDTIHQLRTSVEQLQAQLNDERTAGAQLRYRFDLRLA